MMRTCFRIIAQIRVVYFKHFGIMARDWSPPHDGRQGATGGWNVVVSRAGNRDADFANSTVQIRIEDSRIHHPAEVCRSRRQDFSRAYPDDPEVDFEPFIGKKKTKWKKLQGLPPPA
jgi:hypothetical protein